MHMRNFFTKTCFLVFTLLCFHSYAQDRTLKGRVLSKDGTSLPGASIIVKGSDRGTSANATGEFTLAAPANATLVISFIGYKPQEIAVGNQTSFDISLEEDASILSEVVVTALGIAREKKALGYSVQEVSGKQMTQARTTNFVNALSGKVAGVQVTGTNGAPGA